MINKFKNTGLARMLNKYREGILLSVVIVLLVISLVFNLLPYERLPKIEVNELLLHFINYSVFTFFLKLYFHFQERFSSLNKNCYFYSLIVVGLVSTLIEIAQLYVPHRSFQLSDISANFTGIMVGIIFARTFSLIVRNKSKKEIL